MDREKKTDLLVFSLLRENMYVDGYFNSIDSNVDIWVNKSSNIKIDNLLRSASKKLTGKQGYPEYLIFDKKTETVIIIENKKDTNKHVWNLNLEEKIDEYAVNGALWYAKHLCNDFNVVAIGISGTKRDTLRIDTFLWIKGKETFNNLNINQIQKLQNYIEILKTTNIPKSNKQITLELNNKSKEINDFLRNILNIIEHERLYILGSILYALEDPIFKISYGQTNDNENLALHIYQTLERKVESSKLANKDIIINEIKPVLLGIKNSEKEGVEEKYPNGSLHYLVSIIELTLLGYHTNREIDLISSFFNVFLSYSTSGGSDLGIVLTPPHITELFCRIADINKNSKILDICVGTGGFLTRAWREIALNPNYSFKDKEYFRENNIVGVEIEKSLYTIVALNMFLNKDGKSNLYFGDCFQLKNSLKDKNCNVGFINPPYSDSIYSEISFVEIMLDCLLPDSIGIAILPVNSVSSRTKKHSNILDVKQRILQKNQLLASIQMPSNLFYPKGVETIILVFQTGKENTDMTWLAKFDDGYELIKHQLTRTPTGVSNSNITQLIEAYKSKKDTDFSFNKKMEFDMQWVYEIHNDFNYEITRDDLQETVNNYVSYLYANHYK